MLKEKGQRLREGWIDWSSLLHGEVRYVEYVLYEG